MICGICAETNRPHPSASDGNTLPRGVAPPTQNKRDGDHNQCQRQTSPKPVNSPPTVDCSITAVLPQPVRIDGVQEFEFYSPQFPQSTGKNSMARLPVQETDICLLEGADRQYQSRNSGCIAGSSSVGSLAARPIRPFAAASDSGLAGPTNATSPDTSAFPVTLKRWSTPNPTCGASCGR